MAVRFSMARSDNKSDVFFYSQFSLLLPQCEGHTTCRFLRKPQNGGVSLAFEYETQLMPCFSLQFCNEVFLVLCIFLRYLKKHRLCGVTDATGIDGCGCGCPWEVISGGDFEETCWQIWCIFSFDGLFLFVHKFSSPTQCSTSTHFALKSWRFYLIFCAHLWHMIVKQLCFGCSGNGSRRRKHKKTRSAIVSSSELLVLLAKEKSLTRIIHGWVFLWFL